MTAVPADYPVYTPDDFSPGLERRETLEIPANALERFMDLTSDRHPLHADVDFARERGYDRPVCHGLLVSSLISSFIARQFLGSTGIFVSFAARFHRPVFEGARLILAGRVDSKSNSTGLMNVAWSLSDEAGRLVQNGTAGCLLETVKP